MKTLTNGFKVSDRSYYFLLDWNDEDGRQFMSEYFGKHRLIDLDEFEYRQFFRMISEKELNEL